MVELSKIRKYKKLTPDQRKAAIAKLKAGGSVQSVSEVMGLSLYAVKKIKSDSVFISPALTTKFGPTIKCRVSELELCELDHLVVKYEFKSRSDMLRTLVRSAEGLLEFDKETAAEIETLNRNLLGIGRNLNQISKAANSYKIELVNRQWNELNTLKSALEPLRIYLRRIVKEQRRRGAILFEKYMEAHRD